MNALDQVQTAHLPATWFGWLVKRRLVEACLIDRRLPEPKTFRIASTWPTPIHSFTEIMHWNMPGDGARDRKWLEWENTKGADAIEVSRMEEAFSWLEFLPNIDDRKWLLAWATAAARGLKVLPILRQRRITKSKFYRRIDLAAKSIADRLNSQGVMVR